MATSTPPTKKNKCSGPGRLDRIPLAVKMTLTTLLVGIAVWATLDRIQTKNLKETFQAQLLTRLNSQAELDRQQFNNYVISFHRAAEAFVGQDRLLHAITNKNWQPEDELNIVYHKQSPPWMPQRSIQHIFPPFRFALLIDASGRTREVYHTRPETPSEQLLASSTMVLQMSHGQSMMTTIDNTPYLLTAEAIDHLDSHEIKAALLLATPIDDEVLDDAFDQGGSKYIRALLGEKKTHVLISTNPTAIPPGASLADLKSKYMVIGKEFFDYGISDLEINLVSFASLAEVNALTREITNQARRQQAILALTLILSSLILTYWITRNIKFLTHRIIDFRRQELGLETTTKTRGDELQVLQRNFRELIDELSASREIILQESAKTMAIVDNALDGILSINKQGAVISWNPSAEKIFGIPAAEIIGHNIYEIIIPKKQRLGFEKTMNYFFLSDQETQEKQPDRTIEATVMHRDGHEFPVEIAIGVGELGREKIVIIFVHNISERKKAEAEIIRSKEFAETILNSMNESISIIDVKSHGIVGTNKAFLKKHDLEESNILGHSCHKIIHQHDEICSHEQARCPMNITLSSGRSAREEHVHLDANNEKTYVEISTSPILNENGKIIQVVHIDRDITARRQAEKEKERMISELEAALAEIKTLRGILPICSYCKNIRDDEGYWSQIEVYVQKHSDARFSHGLCPTCAKERYPEIFNQKEDKDLKFD